MNINDYRRAMDRITPSDALKARILSRKSTRPRLPVRRTASVLLAAALTAACLFTAALAASPELRTAVLSLLRIQQREQVPSQSGTPNGPDISGAEIGSLVKAQYIRMDSYRYTLSGDLLRELTWSEDGRTLEKARFWEVRDNALVPAEIDLHTQPLDVTYGGVRYRGELYWYLRDGAVYSFKGSPFGADTQPEDQWNIQTFSGRTDAILLTVTQGYQMERTETPLLYHLDTGETEELLAGVDPAVLEDSDGSIWSPGARRVLITGRPGPDFPDGREWLYDRESGTLTDVRDLGGAGADTAVFVDDDTLILRVWADDPDSGRESISCWVYHIPSGRAVQTLAPSPCYRGQDEDPHGVILFYGGWCMEIGQDGAACLIDLTTGERTGLENFTFQPDMSFSLNPSGDKLLYYARDTGSGGLGISQLGVIDLEEMTFIVFDRDGYENLSEGGICWENNNTVSITASSLDGETQYLLLYKF